MSNNTVFVSPEQMKDMPELIWEGYKATVSRTGSSTSKLHASLVVWAKSVLIRRLWALTSAETVGNRESCNLSEIFLPMICCPEELQDVAQLLKVQKATAALSYLDPASDKITSTNMRLGPVLLA